MEESQKFIRSCQLENTAQEVFEWHKRPGAFERLQPPWEEIAILSKDGKGIENDATLVLEKTIGWLKLNLTIKHQNYIEGEQFQDIQVDGPFKKWEHTHYFKKKDSRHSILEDKIDYKLPKKYSFIHNWLYDYINKQLDKLFNYRYETLKHDLKSHKGKTTLKILISGSSGFIGSSLLPFLTSGGHQVIKLVRNHDTLQPDEIYWDMHKGEIHPSQLEGIDAVIHLAGENIAQRWSEEKKNQIVESRVLGTRVLSRALAGLKDPPKVFISASAIGYYGNRGDEILTEESSMGHNFLAEVCDQWEAATEPAKDRGIRVVNLRFGVVLSPKGGALKQMLLPFKFGLGGVVGSGKQYVSWIAIDDVLGIINTILFNEAIHGPVNAVSPKPITNKEMTEIIGKIMHRPTFMRMPEFAARLVFGQMADELLLNSQRVIPEVMIGSGFIFAYPKFEDALKHLLGHK